MTHPIQPQRDIDNMRLAIAMARRGLGRTAPNPSVGAVLVEPEKQTIIARGWTQPGGRPHAEPHAIAKSGNDARNATLYVTLEPCSHHGRSPPCADAIIKAGVKRVVCGLEDPDPRVAGRGISRLRDAGLEVVVGTLRKECHQLTLGHILRVTERRPFVQLKLALGADGKVPRGHEGQPTWVTGPEARSRGHLLRAQSDAILVGSGTWRDDDPSLTCRLPGLEGQSPLRVILAGSGKPEPAQLGALAASDVPVLWISATNKSEFDGLLRPQDTFVRVTSVGQRPWLPAVMEALVQQGVTRLLVEGGPTIWRAFDRANLVDEVTMFHADPATRSSRQPLEPGEALSAYVSQTPMRLIERYGLSRDHCFVFRRGTVPEWWTA